MGGCQSGPDYAGPAPVVEFDYVNMQITLPLDKYGMQAKEERLLGAARLVEYRNCMVEAGVDPAWLESDDVIADILVGGGDLMPDWRFGYWNADYVAEYGFEGPDQSVGDESEQPVSPERGAAANDPRSAYGQAWDKCSNSDSVEFVWVGRGTLSTKWAVLSDGFHESYDKAEDDKRWNSLYEEWRDCLIGKGYTVPDDFWGAQLPDDATAEMEAKAAVEDAKCSDDLGTAKALAQIEAEYQMDYIEEHKAELVELQDQARELVAQAKALVEGAGFSWQP
jgi:hypothetical protein